MRSREDIDGDCDARDLSRLKSFARQKRSRVSLKHIFAGKEQAGGSERRLKP